MSKQHRLIVLFGLLVAGGLAALVSPFASSAPDGLERVAHDLHFTPKTGTGPTWHGALFADYLMPGLAHKPVATGIAGLLGAALVFAVAYGLLRLLRGGNNAGPRNDA